MPALSMADSTAKFWFFLRSASFTARLSRLAARFFGRVASCARSGMDRAPAKYDHINCETGSGKSKGQGWGLPFGLPIFRFGSINPIIEGSGTPANAGQQPPHLAMRRALNGARTLAGVPPRLSPKGIIPSQRLSFRPGFLVGWTAPGGIAVPE